MHVVTDFTVIERREIDVDLPFALELEEGITVVLDRDCDARLRMLVRRPVDRAALERVVQPGTYRQREDGTREEMYAIRIRDDDPPESVVARDVLSALAFLTDLPWTFSHRIDGDRFEPDDAADEELLQRLGTAEPYVETSVSLYTRTFSRRPTPELVQDLLPRRVGLRIYAGAIQAGFVVAQYRELWRVLESAFTRKNGELISLLAQYPPLRAMGFDENEIRDLHTLRGRASHAESKKGLHELVAVQRECEAALPRFKNLVERVIATKRTWGQPSKGVDETIPLSAWIGRDDQEAGAIDPQD